MNREEFIRVARQVSTWEKGTIPFRAAFDQLIAEFDRLKEMDKELECPEVRIVSDEDMGNPQHPDFAHHRIQCKLLGHICLRERTRGTDCPHYLWLEKLSL